MRHTAEIERQLDLAADVATSNSKHPDMTYEEGVDSALRWVLGYDDEPPMEDE